MILLRKILFPFAILYGIITWFRNFLFDIGILKSYTFDIPIIAVGNLSVGGTGKTPQIEYLIRLLSPKYKIATLSRGYKRTSNGFILADGNATTDTIGDEPFQFYCKFPNILVAVDSDRRNGIEKLLEHRNKPGIILLDDAFQHRKVKAGLYVLLTAYGDLYVEDLMLPTGNLRESKSGADRADVIVVTKCPSDISIEAQNRIRNKFKLNKLQQLYFSTIEYDQKVYSENQSLNVSEIKNTQKLLLAGIAKPKPFFAYLQNEHDVIMEFPDHRQFSQNDIAEIKHKAGTNKIITTEKDYVRLKGQLPNEQLFYLPIKTRIFECDKFDNTILNYVGTSTTNS